MTELVELWDLSWSDGIMFIIILMGLYTYKVWIDNKFKKMKPIEQSICEEFSNKVHLTYTEKPFYQGQSICAPEIEEIKCIIQEDFFDAILDRMEQIGYYCSSFQRCIKKASHTLV